MNRSNWWKTSISDISPGIIRYHGYPVEQLISSEHVGMASMIWLMTRGELPTVPQARLLERALVAGVDHGPQAPSIAIARMAMTCGVGINSAMASATNVLGDVHGGAGQELMEIFRTILDDPRPLSEAVEAEIKRLRSDNRYVPGFGHRFHPVDPRRAPLVAAVETARDVGVVEGRHLEVALEIERQINLNRDRPIPMNIDGATAIIYAELGFEPVLGRGLFILSRSVGALAHAWEESQSSQRNKGPEHRSILPTYTGSPERAVP
ncbi:citryl-CoA lyase [Arthrobacter sulfonylureivorans]|uniref:citrate synthase (unknown stereospecificity) n=1 Tax=Arthrobacter sulfonylureivorans TaxID=2486855 RepID=A0ABY3W5Y0_9MICC|nr:citryl-CoA lyase [Arthrobacter sulfonylureivorans]UNK45689.1 citryl-CoA lyase [Arthrobacter sulfonylureivorans]